MVCDMSDELSQCDIQQQQHTFQLIELDEKHFTDKKEKVKSGTAIRIGNWQEEVDDRFVRERVIQQKQQVSWKSVYAKHGTECLSSRSNR